MFFSVFQFEDINIYKKNYDKAANLVYLERRSFNDVYFSLDTKYTYHLLESVEYALILLKEHTDESLKTAEAILNTVLSFQETNPQSSFYSLFPVFPEVFYKYHKEDPDTTFKITVLFLQILLNYKHLLSNELVTRIRKACYSVAFYNSLCNNANIHNYSYIHFLEIYILLQTGNMLNKPDFINSGMTTFNSIYWGIKYNENFWEYNSPYDYYLFSEMLILIKQILGNNEKYINMLDELYDLLWENIAMNFHRAMRTMTGPQSDQSKLLTSRYFALFLEKAVGIQLSDKKTKIPDNILSRCPRKYIRYFYDNKPNRFIQQLIGRGSSYFYFTVSQIASNYLQPEYAIGSFNRQQFWRAHTPIAAYLKSEESKPPYFIRLKVLNDNHDYSSGELHCVQNKGIILGHIIFSTNRGDKHPDYDLKYGKLISSDFRIRFEINGNINNLEVISGKNSLTIKYKNITLRYRVPLVCMDNIPVTFELKKNKEHMYFDVVFTIGPNSEIDLTKLKKAICQFVLQITASDRPLEDVKNTFEKGYLVSELPAGDFKLKIESPHKPDSFEYLNTHDRQYINDIRLEQYTALNQIKTMQYRFIADSNAGIDLPAFSDDSDILKELENLKKAPIEKINNIIKDYLDRLSSNNFTLDIFKRYAVHIAILLFERASAENFQFEQIIKNNYYNIYQNISAAPSTESVCKLLLKMTEMIQKDNEELDIKLKKTNTVSDVIEIIDNNYQNPLLSLSMIAEMLGLSEYYISRAFKKNTNTNYVKYLIRVRMEKAKELLDDGIPAENAAKECGYMNIFSFKRAFKSYTGMTITDWKKHRKLESAK